MAKKTYILKVSNRTALARNKRLREAGASVYINGSTIAGNSGGSGIDEKGVVDVDVQGSGNAVTDARLSSDGSTIVLNKGKTFLDNTTAEGKFIRKDQDDGTDYNLYVGGDFTVYGDTTVVNIEIMGGATIQDFLDVYGKITAHGGLQLGDNFVSGLLGEGGYFDNKGYGEMRGLTLWEWLEVPELRYNRVTVNTGITWQTFGGGIIESVEITGDNSGIITLKLEDGEIGTIAQDDLCMGIYHNFGGENDTEDVDEHNGNFHFSGFKTIYFRVVEILDTDTNGKFSYVLRESQQGHWTEQNHPSECMHFACYANPNNTDRQNCHYSTTKYLMSLQNMTDWEYGNNNIYYIRGILEGFTVGDTELHGNGIYIGNGYFSGIMQQITNAPYALNIEYTQGSILMEEGDTVDITCTITKGWEDMTDKVATWVVKRETGDTEADEEWNNAHTDFNGTIEVTYSELFSDEVTSALLRFTATLEDGTEVSNSTILHAYASGKNGRGIAKVVNYYGLSNDMSVEPTTWEADPETLPQVSADNRYLWNKETTTYTDGTEDEIPAHIMVMYSEEGRGIRSITEYYAVNNSATTPPSSSSWSENVPTTTEDNRYLWNYEEIEYTDDTTHETAKRVIGTYGETGATGATGADGVGIEAVTEYYGTSTSPTTEPSSWYEKFSDVVFDETNKYLWNKETITYSKGEPETTDPAIIGIYSVDGDDGRGISNIEEWYLASDKATGVTREGTSGWKNDVTEVTITSETKYLWNYEKITYDNGDVAYTEAVLIGAYGDTGDTGATGADGKDGNGIKSITEYYGANNSTTTEPSSWKTDLSEVTWNADNPYLWNYEVTEFTEGSSETTPHVIAVWTVDGQDGRGIESITEWYALSTTTDESSRGKWQTPVPEMTETNRYLWNKEEITFTEGDPQETDPRIIGVYGAQGADGLYIIPTVSNIVFAEGELIDESLSVSAYRGGEQISLGTSAVQVTSTPSGAEVDKQSLGGGVVMLGLYRDTATTKVDGSLVYTVRIDGVEYEFTCGVKSVFNGEDGADAVTVTPVPDNLVFAEGDRTKTFTIEAYRGSEQVALTTSNLSNMSGLSGLSSSASASGGVITITLTRTDLTANVEGNVTFTITIDNVGYDRAVGISSVFNGEQGEKGDKGDKGDDGEDAIYYELELSCETLEYNAFAGAFAPSTIDIQVVKVEGTTRSYVPFNLTLLFRDSEGNTLGRVIEDNITTYTFEPSAKGGWGGVVTRDIPYNSYFEFSVYPTENTAVFLSHAIYPTTTYYPRVRYWDDVAEGGQFCQGKLGEQYRDIVIHPKNSNSYFYCKVSHTKSSASEPQAGTETEYWRPMSYYETIATNLLLAETAKINNLYVDDLFMVGEASAIWINPNHEGMKIVRASDLTSDEYKDQSGESAWLKPTAYFHANSIPEMADYYGGSQISGSGSIGTWTYTAGDTVFNITETVQKSGTIATLPSGRSLAISVPAISISVTEGEEDTSLDASLVNVGVWACLGNSATAGSQGATIEFAIGASGSKSGTIATQTINITNGTGASQAVWLEVRIWNTSLKSGAIVQQMNTINVSALGDVLTGYASQYGADGMFMAVSDASYFRVKVQESAQQYSMFADGTGIDISQQGSIQKVAGNSMPLGGCLALVNISVSSALAAFDVWTFDGASLSGQYYGTGIYRVFFPSSWADKFGTFDMYKMVVTTSYQSNGSTIGVSVQKSTYSGYWGYLNIHVVNGTTYTDVPVSLRIDYMSSVTSREMSQSTSAITPLSMIQDAEIINE